MTKISAEAQNAMELNSFCNRIFFMRHKYKCKKMNLLLTVPQSHHVQLQYMQLCAYNYDFCNFLDLGGVGTQPFREQLTLVNPPQLVDFGSRI